MKKLIIAEKPSVAKNIADATASSRRNGYFEGQNYIITWAFGHLLQLYDARDYDPEMRSWKIEKFPYIPEKFLYKIKSDGKNKDKPDRCCPADGYYKKPDEKIRCRGNYFCDG